MRVALLVLLVAMTGCERTQNLNDAGCLPLRAPTEVTLLQEAGLFRNRSNAGPFLNGLPRDTVNDAFHGIEQIRVVRAGTVLTIRELSQRHGFDSGAGTISAFGTTPEGEPFQYGWGSGTQIGRAPWEPASTPNLRTVDCSG